MFPFTEYLIVWVWKYMINKHWSIENIDTGYYIRRQDVLYDTEGKLIKSNHMVLSAQAETEATRCTTEVACAVTEV